MLLWVGAWLLPRGAAPKNTTGLSGLGGRTCHCSDAAIDLDEEAGLLRLLLWLLI
jgi:hypothetical protein